MDQEFTNRLNELLNKAMGCVKHDEVMEMDEMIFIPLIMSLLKEYELRHPDFCMVDELLTMLDMELTLRGRKIKDFLSYVVSNMD